MNEIRRIFRARYKINEPGTISHITQRAPGREVLFLEKADYLFMLYLIKETVEKFSLDMFSFVLMPNHLHLHLRQLKRNLPEAMKNLFERYADYFNVKYERKGHVFCGRYGQAVCLDESYFYAINVYIHINPVRARLVANPLDYSWSSIKPYVMPIKSETFLNYRFVLNMLREDINEAREIYKGLLTEALKVKTEDVFENPKAMESFRSLLNNIIHKIFGTQVKDIISVFDIELNKKIDELRSKNRLRNPEEKEARRYLIQQLLSRGYKISEVAGKLGVARQSIYRLIS